MKLEINAEFLNWLKTFGNLNDNLFWKNLFGQSRTPFDNCLSVSLPSFRMLTENMPKRKRTRLRGCRWDPLLQRPRLRPPWRTFGLARRTRSREALNSILSPLSLSSISLLSKVATHRHVYQAKPKEPTQFGSVSGSEIQNLPFPLSGIVSLYRSEPKEPT